MKSKLLFFALLGFIMFSCEEDPIVIDPENPYENISAFVHPVDASLQRVGDAEIGKEYLIYGDYIDAGIPRAIYDQTLGAGSSKDNLLNRTGINQDIPFGLTSIVNNDNVEMVVANCLQCHAGVVNGEFYLGLGNTFANYTSDQSSASALLDNLVEGTYGINSVEYKAYAPFSRALKATGPYLLTETVGSNPADKLALVLAANRKPDDLKWADELNFEIPEATPPSDVPPWWHMKKKNAMFSTGLGQGDFAKHMMTSSILTLEDTTKAVEVDAKFADVLAYIQSIEAPSYPGDVDFALADQGQLIFQENCAKCHGTYGETESYPNLFVDRELIETDRSISEGTVLFADFVNWFNASWFANSEYPAVYAQVDGYMAPPLDGLWATAPYLHNGSVPTLKHLLWSKDRPQVWRKSQITSSYNHDEVGLSYSVQSSKIDEFTYDCSIPGYSNVGHYFADYLSDLQRTQLLEYLKTL